jgi:hypothetical protein
MISSVNEYLQQRPEMGVQSTWTLVLSYSTLVEEVNVFGITFIINNNNLLYLRHSGVGLEINLQFYR